MPPRRATRLRWAAPAAARLWRGSAAARLWRGSPGYRIPTIATTRARMPADPTMTSAVPHRSGR